MKKYLLILSLFFLFISCDKSFSASEPFSYDKTKSKVAQKCRTDIDCDINLEICDFNTNKCIENPCITENVNCLNGTCSTDNKTLETSCKCYENYQDNDNNKTCEPTCRLDNICDDEHSKSCDDRTGKTTCECDEGYFQTDKYQCITPCNQNTCGSNGICEATSVDTFNCNCIDGFFKDGDTCVNPCLGETCSNHGSCKAISLTEKSCECDENYFQNRENHLECIYPCDNHEFCGGNGICTVIDYDNTVCNCNTDFQDKDNDKLCEIACKSPQVCNSNVRGDECDDSSGKVICDCKEGYFQDENFQCVTPCTQNSCANNEICVATGFEADSFRCDCIEGFFKDGDTCVNPCASENCNNHGTCIATELNQKSCECDENYFQNRENPLECISPCDNHEFCGGDGVCSIVDYGNAVCNCNENYQDKDNDLRCEISCESPQVCNSNVKGDECDDSSGKVICDCKEGYFQDENFQCVTPCTQNSCANNEICVATGFEADSFRCDCIDGFFKDGETCVNPCSNENCNNHGNCISISLNEKSCECNEENGYFKNPNNNLECASPCETNPLCGGNGLCASVNYTETICNCNEGFQDNNGDKICERGCSSLNTCTQNASNCDDSTGVVECACNEGFYQNTAFQCVNPCEGVVCGKNEVCNIIDIDNYECVCDENYFWDLNSETCKTPCAGVICGENRECVASDLNNYNCDCVENYYENNYGNCISPCIGNETCGGHGNCKADSLQEYYCECDEGYKALPYELTCKDTCQTVPCSYRGTCSEDTGVPICSCNDGYELSIDKKECYLIDSEDWVKDFSIECTKLRIDDDGNVYIIGRIDHGSFDLNPNEGKDIHEVLEISIFIIKLDGNGKYLWGKTYPTFKFQTYRDVKIKNNILYLLMTFSGSYTKPKIYSINTSTGSLINSYTINYEDVYPGALYVDNFNNTYISGYFTGYIEFTQTENYDSGNGNLFLMKLDSDFNYKFTKQISVQVFSDINIRRIIIEADSSDNLYISGELNGENGGFLAKFKDDTLDILKLIKSDDLMITFSDFKIDDDNNLYVFFNEAGGDIINFDDGAIVSERGAGGGSFVLKYNSSLIYIEGKGILLELFSEGLAYIYKNKVYTCTPNEGINIFDDNINLLRSIDIDNNDISQLKVDKYESIYALNYAGTDFKLYKFKQHEQGTTCNGYEDCGGNGVCLQSSISAPVCNCGENYQDNDGNLICESSCSITDCSNHGTCNDESGIAICNCEENYQSQIFINDCLPDCRITNCGDNGVCNESESGVFSCECNEGYQDNDGDLICKESCLNYDCVNGICNDNTGERTCNCASESILTDNGTCKDKNELISFDWGYLNTYIYNIENSDFLTEIDSNGNIYLAGKFNNNPDFNPNTNETDFISEAGEYFITKFDINGNYIWTKVINTTALRKLYIGDENKIHLITDNNEIIYDAEGVEVRIIDFPFAIENNTEHYSDINTNGLNRYIIKKEDNEYLQLKKFVLEDMGNNDFNWQEFNSLDINSAGFLNNCYECKQSSKFRVISDDNFVYLVLVFKGFLRISEVNLNYINRDGATCVIDELNPEYSQYPYQIALIKFDKENLEYINHKILSDKFCNVDMNILSDSIRIVDFKINNKGALFLNYVYENDSNENMVLRNDLYKIDNNFNLIFNKFIKYSGMNRPNINEESNVKNTLTFDEENSLYWYTMFGLYDGNDTSIITNLDFLDINLSRTQRLYIIQENGSEFSYNIFNDSRELDKLFGIKLMNNKLLLTGYMNNENNTNIIEGQSSELIGTGNFFITNWNFGE